MSDLKKLESALRRALGKGGGTIPELRRLLEELERMNAQMTALAAEK